MPTWSTAGATLGLFAGPVVPAFYAQKTFASQAEQLREQRDFNRRQAEFNERQLTILHNQELVARQAERRQRTPRFRADVLTRNDGSMSMYLHLRLLSEENRLRLTGARPATALAALATYSSIPCRVRRARSARYW
jgi:hypothetical protein